MANHSGFASHHSVHKIKLVIDGYPSLGVDRFSGEKGMLMLILSTATGSFIRHVSLKHRSDSWSQMNATVQRVSDKTTNTVTLLPSSAILTMTQKLIQSQLLWLDHCLNHSASMPNFFTGLGIFNNYWVKYRRKPKKFKYIPSATSATGAAWSSQLNE